MIVHPADAADVVTLRHFALGQLIDVAFNSGAFDYLAVFGDVQNVLGPWGTLVIWLAFLTYPDIQVLGHLLNFASCLVALWQLVLSQLEQPLYALVASADCNISPFDDPAVLADVDDQLLMNAWGRWHFLVVIVVGLNRCLIAPGTVTVPLLFAAGVVGTLGSSLFGRLTLLLALGMLPLLFPGIRYPGIKLSSLPGV